MATSSFRSGWYLPSGVLYGEIRRDPERPPIKEKRQQAAALQTVVEGVRGTRGPDQAPFLMLASG
jgi:hypothetical protein